MFLFIDTLKSINLNFLENVPMDYKIHRESLSQGNKNLLTCK